MQSRSRCYPCVTQESVTVSGTRLAVRRPMVSLGTVAEVLPKVLPTIGRHESIIPRRPAYSIVKASD